MFLNLIVHCFPETECPGSFCADMLRIVLLSLLTVPLVRMKNPSSSCLASLSSKSILSDIMIVILLAS